MSEAQWLAQTLQTEENAVSVVRAYGLKDEDAAKKLSRMRDYFPKDGADGVTFYNTLMSCARLYEAKLDWLLFSPDFDVIDTSIGGKGLSDHLCISCLCKMNQ